MKLRDAAQMGGGKDECKLAEWWLTRQEWR